MKWPLNSLPLPKRVIGSLVRLADICRAVSGISSGLTMVPPTPRTGVVVEPAVATGVKIKGDCVKPVKVPSKETL